MNVNQVLRRKGIRSVKSFEHLDRRGYDLFKTFQKS